MAEAIVPTETSTTPPATTPPATTPPATTPATPPAATPPAGEKTFTQAEVDRIISERLARAKTPPAIETPTPPDTTIYETQIKELKGTLASARIEAAMSASGIKAERITRAAKLVDMDKCLDEKGNPSTEKIKAEVDAILKDFPELAGADNSQGFRIGSDGKQMPKAGATEISSIFGNKKG